MEDTSAVIQEKPKKSKKWLWWFLPLGLILIGGLIFLIVLLEDGKYKMTFSSVDYDSSYVYAYIDISGTPPDNFESTSFAIYKGNDLISAENIDYVNWSIEGDKTMKISFKVNYNSINKPTTIFYKGKKLTVGKSIKTKH